MPLYMLCITINIYTKIFFEKSLKEEIGESWVTCHLKLNCDIVYLNSVADPFFFFSPKWFLDFLGTGIDYLSIPFLFKHLLFLNSIKISQCMFV